MTTFERRSRLKNLSPQLEWNRPKTYKVDISAVGGPILTNHPIFKIAILRREKIFSPERRSKVVKFAKNDRLDALIILARDERF